MTIMQFNPPIPIKTPKGEALAHVLIDYGIEHDLNWVCFIDETSECWTFRNKDIRACNNITYGRTKADNVERILYDTWRNSSCLKGS